MSNKEVLHAWNFTQANGLLSALADALAMARNAGHRGETVYPNKFRMTLVRETLTDGSHVMNLHLFDGGDTRSDRQCSDWPSCNCGRGGADHCGAQQ